MYNIPQNLIKATEYAILTSASLLVYVIILYVVLHAMEVELYNQRKSTLFQPISVIRKQWRTDTARITKYSRITCIKYPPSARITYLTVPLRRSGDYSYYINRRILAPPPVWSIIMLI